MIFCFSSSHSSFAFALVTQQWLGVKGKFLKLIWNAFKKFKSKILGTKIPKSVPESVMESYEMKEETGSKH